MRHLTFVSGLLSASLFSVSVGSAQELGLPPQATEADFVVVPAVPRKMSLAVAATNRAAVVHLFHNAYKASQGIPSGWDGDRASCHAGMASEGYTEATLLRVNYYRAMAGLPGDITLNENWNLKAQDAALMMSVRRELNHFPDSSWSCYTAGGAEAAGKSNLALGVDAAEAIDLYMDDSGAANSAVGHRRWMLYPPAKVMGIGNVPGTGGLAANDLWVIGGSGSRPSNPEYVAWPPPGYIPYQVMPRRSQRWSFSYPSANLSNTRVFLECHGTNVPVTLENLAVGYGDNTIVWRPQGLLNTVPQQDLECHVTVSNVVINAQSRAFNYAVTIVDPDLPVLSIGIASPGAVELSWPVTSTAYELERNSSVSNPNGWTAANLPVQVIGNRSVVTVPSSTGTAYFRLARP